jgi:hypothetical protein
MIRYLRRCSPDPDNSKKRRDAAPSASRAARRLNVYRSKCALWVAPGETAQAVILKYGN